MEREREFFWVTRNFIRLLEPLLLPTQPNSGLAALDRGGLGALQIPPRAALCSLPSWHVPAFHESLCEPCPEHFSDWVEPCQALPALKSSLSQSKGSSTEARDVIRHKSEDCAAWSSSAKSILQPVKACPSFPAGSALGHHFFRGQILLLEPGNLLFLNPGKPWECR